MITTPNYGLKKPEGNDFVGPGAFNDNADILDAALQALAESAGEAADKAPTGDAGQLAVIDAQGNAVGSGFTISVNPSGGMRFSY